MKLEVLNPTSALRAQNNWPNFGYHRRYHCPQKYWICSRKGIRRLYPRSCWLCSKTPNFSNALFVARPKIQSFPQCGWFDASTQKRLCRFWRIYVQLGKHKNGTLCLIVTLDKGVVLKKVFNYLDDKGILVLKSLNERYAPISCKHQCNTRKLAVCR